MLGGAAEPLYVPAKLSDANQQSMPAQLYYREDYAASALHEAAHWCIAGASRRRLLDFGYTYLENPRTRQQQQFFYRLELKTQTLEMLFATQTDINFQVSADNLNACPVSFATQVSANQKCVANWVRNSADQRARKFLHALSVWSA